jgi:hypothetical protein
VTGDVARQQCQDGFPPGRMVGARCFVGAETGVVHREFGAAVNRVELVRNDGGRDIGPVAVPRDTENSPPSARFPCARQPPLTTRSAVHDVVW